jgi:hypothetical protein
LLIGTFPAAPAVQLLPENLQLPPMPHPSMASNVIHVEYFELRAADAVVGAFHRSTGPIMFAVVL